MNKSNSTRFLLPPMDLCLFYAGIFLLSIEYGKIFGNLYISDLLIFISFLLVLQRDFLLGKVRFVTIIFSKRNVFASGLLLMTIGFLLSSYRTEEMWENFTRYIQFVFIFLILFPLVFYFINYRSIRSRKILLIFFCGVAVNVILLLAFAFFGISIGNPEALEGALPKYAGLYGQRYTILGNEPNEIARLIALPIPFIWYYVHKCLSLAGKVFVLVVYILFLTGIALTVSKTGFLIVFTAFVLYFLIDRWKFKSTVFVSILILGGFFGIRYLDQTILEPRPIVRRFIQAWTGEDSSMTFRLNQYREVISNAHHYIIAGLGFDNPKSGIHNVLLESFVDLGTFGMLGFVLFYSIPIGIAWFQLRRLKRMSYASREEQLFVGGYFIACVSLLVGDMFMTYSLERSLWLIPIIAISYIAAFFNNSQKLESEDRRRQPLLPE